VKLVVQPKLDKLPPEIGGVEDDVAPGVVAAAEENPDEPSVGDIDRVLVDPLVGDLDLSLCFKIRRIPGDFEEDEESAPFSMWSAAITSFIPSSNPTPFVVIFPNPAVPESYRFGSLRGLKLSSDRLLFNMERLGFLE
jgi:hypothetical protein